MRPLVPKEDHRRGEAPAEGAMLEGVLDPLSISLQCPTVLSLLHSDWYNAMRDVQFSMQPGISVVRPYILCCLVLAVLH